MSKKIIILLLRLFFVTISTDNSTSMHIQHTLWESAKTLKLVTDSLRFYIVCFQVEKQITVNDGVFMINLVHVYQ